MKFLKWTLYSVAGVVGAFLILSMVLGFLMESNIVPSDRVLTGAEVSERHLAALREAKLIEPDESITLFYSLGIFSVLGGGSILTENRVTTYLSSGGELESWSIPYEKIVSIEQEAQGSIHDHAEYRVRASGRWLMLRLPQQDGDDKRFVAALRERMN